MNLHQFRQILIVTVLLPLVLLLLLALVLGWQFQRTLREQRTIDHTGRITAQLIEMERLVVDQETALRSFQRTHDPTTLEPYQNAEGALHASLDQLLSLVKDDPEQLRRLREIRESHEQWMGFAGEALDSLRAGKIFGVPSLDVSGAQMMVTLRTQIATMTEIEVRRRDEEVESTDMQVRQLMTFLLLSSVGTGIVLGIYTQRNMRKVSNAFRTSLEDSRRRDVAMMAHEKLAVAGRLSASIAHEIHNPLDSVANLHYLMAKESDPVLRQKYLTMAQQELHRTLQISRAMLGLYREPKAPVAVDLRELLESVLLLLDRQLKDKSVIVDRRLSEGASIQGFPGELRQVFTNLITNGAEASGPGGRLQVLLEASNQPGALVVISDTGPGIADDNQAKLFKPFFTTKGELGTGLGLWVSRGIVEKHGGKIELVNSTDPAFPGASVRVFLPPLGAALKMALTG